MSELPIVNTNVYTHFFEHSFIPPPFSNLIHTNSIFKNTEKQPSDVMNRYIKHLKNNAKSCVLSIR